MTLHVPILRSGVIAEQFCRDVLPAKIEAVFDRCFYLRSGDEFICVGEPDIGNGPLTLIGDLGRWPDLGLQPGTPAEICDRHIAIGDSICLTLDQTMPWRPSPWPGLTSQRILFGTFVALAHRAAVAAPPEGLARCVSSRRDTSAQSPLARAAQPRIAVFERWLSSALDAQAAPATAAHDAIQGLIGLGPGLTPSGDDFLMGALALLDAIGERKAHAGLAGAIIDLAPDLTTPLSACFLRAATAGHVGEALHRIISSVITGDVDVAIATADRIGHSSGWDMLAGVMTALGIAVAARRTTAA